MGVVPSGLGTVLNEATGQRGTQHPAAQQPRPALPLRGASPPGPAPTAGTRGPRGGRGPHGCVVQSVTELGLHSVLWPVPIGFFHSEIHF